MTSCTENIQYLDVRFRVEELTSVFDEVGSIKTYPLSCERATMPSLSSTVE